jgi:tetratricopeptide (TPR) repeat protein
MNDLTADRWQHLDGLLAEAFARSPDARTAYLRAACGDDPALYREALAMLESADAAARALGESAADFAAPLLADELVDEAGASDDDLAPGTLVGPYRIEGEAGRGGMGVVYRAARADGAFRKEVALKLVKRGMDTDELLRRFRREREVLAALDHPGIARLLDGGATPDGRPYFAMEYVAGEPITAYADRRRLGVEARLALFDAACEAVQHAHRRLVVHRDLKPSNVLVAEGEPPAGGGRGAPQVKLLDFGIARLLDEGPDEALTQTGARRLTPAYAAPEQARGEAVTTAADVYALGVLLYELLTAARPEARPGAPPRPPSAAVTGEGAEARGTSAERLRRRLRGDLDVICLKALREEPEERYPSVEALLEDLRRYRSGLPVAARPASQGYRVRKFVARHRAGVAASALGAVALAVGLGAVLWQAQIAARERDRAEGAAHESGEATRFLASVFEEADPEAAGGDTLNAFQMLDRGAARLQTELADAPALRARLLFVFGDVYTALARHDTARPLYEQALALRRSLYGEVHPEVAASLYGLAASHLALSHRDLADSLFSAWEAMTARLPEEASPDQAGRFQDLGYLFLHRRDYAQAEVYVRRAYALHERLYGRASEEAIKSANGLGLVLITREAHAEAEALMREQLRLLDELETDREPLPALRGGLLNTRAEALRGLGRFDEAGAAYRAAIAVRRSSGTSAPEIASWLSSYGGLLEEQGRLPEAEAAIRDAVAEFEQHFGEGSFYAMHIQQRLGDVLAAQGEYADAEGVLREAYDRLRAERGVEDSFTQEAVASLIALYERWGRPAEAARFRALVVEVPTPARYH